MGTSGHHPAQAVVEKGLNWEQVLEQGFCVSTASCTMHGPQLTPFCSALLGLPKPFLPKPCWWVDGWGCQNPKQNVLVRLPI